MRSIGFLLLYALAHAGGTIGFLPLLSLLLPLKVEAVAGDARLTIFTTAVIAGSIAASLSNIAFGWLSDRSVARRHGRRRLAAGGLLATALSYGAIAAATTPTTIVLAVILFQIALNAVLAPVTAIMADEIPDRQKGLAAGFLSLANPAAAAVLAAAVALAPGEPLRLAIVVAAFTLCIVPLLVSRAIPARVTRVPHRYTAAAARDLAAAWCARLLVQTAGCVLQLYLLYYFESLAPASGDPAARVGALLTLSFVLPIPIAIAIGRLSDRIGRRTPFLLAAASVAALGLAGMAMAQDWTFATVAFGLYAIGSGVFLPLQVIFAMQLLPDPAHRGRDLGLLNLTNTLPSLLGAALTWLLATPHDFDALMLTLAALAFGGGLAMLGARERR